MTILYLVKKSFNLNSFATKFQIIEILENFENPRKSESFKKFRKFQKPELFRKFRKIQKTPKTSANFNKSESVKISEILEKSTKSRKIDAKNPKFCKGSTTPACDSKK